MLARVAPVLGVALGEREALWLFLPPRLFQEDCRRERHGEFVALIALLRIDGYNCTVAGADTRAGHLQPERDLARGAAQIAARRALAYEGLFPL